MSKSGNDADLKEGLPESPQNYDGGYTKPKEKGTLFTLEELTSRTNTSAAIVAAVSEANGWVYGKKVSQKEFEGAIKNFLNAPAGGANASRY